MQPAVFVIVRASRSVAQPAQIAPLFAPFLVQVPSGSPPPTILAVVCTMCAVAGGPRGSRSGQQKAPEGLRSGWVDVAGSHRRNSAER